MLAFQIAAQLPEDPKAAAAVSYYLRDEIVLWLEGKHPSPWTEQDPVLRSHVLRVVGQLDIAPEDARLVTRYLCEDVLPWLEGRIGTVRRGRGKIQLVANAGKFIAASSVTAAMVLRANIGYLDQLFSNVLTA